MFLVKLSKLKLKNKEAISSVRHERIGPEDGLVLKSLNTEDRRPKSNVWEGEQLSMSS